jgi:hypothetical protein
MNGLVYAMRSNAARGWSFLSHSQRLLTDTLLPAATLRIQEDKISSFRRRGCHGKRFDTFVTPYLAGHVQRYFVLVRIIVVQYELALNLTASPVDSACSCA